MTELLVEWLITGVGAGRVAVSRRLRSVLDGRAGYRLQIAEPQQPLSSQRRRVNPNHRIPIVATLAKPD
jgi:hypothetical protein